MDDDDFVESGNCNDSVSDMRERQECLCMRCWGEFDIVECVIDPANTIANRKTRADMYTEYLNNGVEVE